MDHIIRAVKSQGQFLEACQEPIHEWVWRRVPEHSLALLLSSALSIDLQ